MAVNALTNDESKQYPTTVIRQEPLYTVDTNGQKKCIHLITS